MEQEQNTKFIFKFVEYLWQGADHYISQKRLREIFAGKKLKPSCETEKMFIKAMKSIEIILSNEITEKTIYKIFNIWVKNQKINRVKIKKIINIIKSKKSNSLYTMKKLFVYIIKNKVFKKYNIEMAKLLSNAVLIKDKKAPITMYTLKTFQLCQAIISDNYCKVEEIFLSFIQKSNDMKKKHKLLSLKLILETIISKINVLQGEYNIRHIYLFGSHSRNEQNEYSDLDFIIEVGEETVPTSIYQKNVREYFEKIFNINVDIIFLKANKNNKKIPIDIESEKIKII